MSEGPPCRSLPTEKKQVRFNDAIVVRRAVEDRPASEAWISHPEFLAFRRRARRALKIWKHYEEDLGDLALMGETIRGLKDECVFIQRKTSVRRREARRIYIRNVLELQDQLVATEDQDLIPGSLCFYSTSVTELARFEARERAIEDASSCLPMLGYGVDDNNVPANLLPISKLCYFVEELHSRLEARGLANVASTSIVEEDTDDELELNVQQERNRMVIKDILENDDVIPSTPIKRAPKSRCLIPQNTVTLDTRIPLKQ